MNMKNKACCLFEARYVYKTDMLSFMLEKLELLITREDINTFLFSDYEFNQLKQAIDILKEKYPHIQRIYVATRNRKRNIFSSNFYDDIIYFDTDTVLAHNTKIVDISDYCIFYEYKRTDTLKKTYLYAQKQNKKLIIFKKILICHAEFINSDSL